jgi:DNA repair exonuclease SbcCD ATPase subunit
MVIDGHTITRKRESGRNRYAFDGKRYDAIRRDVPNRIRSSLRVGVLNFQSQHDGPFWLSDSASSVSRELNAIVDLEIIDRTLANVASESRNASTVLRHTEGRFQSALQEVKDLKWVKACQEEYEVLEAKEKVLAQLRNKAADLGSALAKAGKAQASLARGQDRLVEAQILLIAAKAAYKAAKARKGLETTLQAATEAEQRASLTLPSHHRLGFAQQHREELETLINKLERENKTWHDRQRQLDTNSKQLEKKAGERCPVCGQKIK